MPNTIQRSVATEIIASVAIVSGHIPRYPIIKKAVAENKVASQLLDVIQAKPVRTSIVIGHGDSISNFSSHTRVSSSGSKKISIASP
jgi:hypothetical protein